MFDLYLSLILCHQKGCECNILPLSGAVCKCKTRPILHDDGNYSLAKLRTHDRDWHEACLTGISWECLSWEMDVEEPEAALVISIALNKKNEAAMKTDGVEA